MAGNSYAFGDFRIEPAVRELWHGARLVALPPHVFDCLAYLIEHRDRAVGRDELVAAVWGKTEVSDTLLGQTVMRVRRELGDDGKDQRIVRTIPRFGYCWVAAIDEHTDTDDISPDAEPNAGEAQSADKGSARAAIPAATASADSKPMFVATSTGVRWALVLLPLIVVVGLVLYVIPRSASIDTPGQSTQSAPAEAAAVALATLDPGTQQEWSWLRFGVMDVVANRLRSSGLPTLPSESMVALLNSKSLHDSGSLRKAGEFSLLVTPEVLQSAGGWQVRLDADDGRAVHVSVDAHAHEATEAARLASDKLLVVLGRAAPNAAGEAEPQLQLVKRVDAAILADDPATARALIQKASAAQQNLPELNLRLAKLDFRAGHTAAARDRLLAMLQEATDQAPVLRAEILNGLGAVAIRDDKPALAGDYFSQAVALLEPRAELAKLGEAYLGRAAAAAEQRHFDLALGDYARARVALRQVNDTLALLRVSVNEGFLDLELGRPAQALPQLIVAAKGFEQWGAINEAIFTYMGQVNAYLALLEPDKAMAAADAAEVLAGRIESRTTLDSLTLARAKALAAAGKAREARKELVNLREHTPPPDRIADAAAAVQLARLALTDGDPAAAVALVDPVLDALTQPSYTSLRTQGWWLKVLSHARLGDASAAGQALAGFTAWAAHDDNSEARAFLALAQAQYDWRFGVGDWHAMFAKATSIAEDGAVPAIIAEVAGAYADALLSAGELDLAETQIGRLSRWSDRDFGSAVLEARLYAALGRDDARQAALARARALAGERTIPKDASRVPISTQAASTP